MGENRRRIGFEYETIAENYLIEQGYVILERNFYCKSGEIDRVARDGAYLVFVEVKYRKNAVHGAPFEAVNYKKQQRIRRSASFYMLKHGYGSSTPCRFDIVSICGQEIVLFKNAFY